jgi:hypothetical protein
MYQVKNKVMIGSDLSDTDKYIVLNNVFEFEVNNSNSEIPSTGTLTITKKDIVISGSEIRWGKYSFKLWDRIRIYSTYFHNGEAMDDTFIYEGFVTDYHTDNAFIKFTLESNSVLLKKSKRVNFSLNNPKLSDILMKSFESYSPSKESNVIKLSGKFIGDYEQSFEIHFQELELEGNWNTDNEPKSAMEIFNIIREEFKADIFEFENKIYIAIRYPESDVTHKFAYPYLKGYNYVIDNKLQNKMNDIEKYIIKAKSVVSPTKTIQLAYAYGVNGAGYVEYSTERDITETLNLPPYKESSMKKIIESTWDKLIQGGVKDGSFLTFGYPIVRLGNRIIFNYQGEEQTYLVDGVKVKSGNNGIRYEVLLGLKTKG